MIRISDIQEMISSFRQGELTITNYFTQLKILWDELDLFCRYPLLHVPLNAILL